MTHIPSDVDGRNEGEYIYIYICVYIYIYYIYTYMKMTLHGGGGDEINRGSSIISISLKSVLTRVLQLETGTDSSSTL